MRTALAALAALAMLVPAAAQAGPFGKKKALPAVAVWDLQTNNILGNAGAPYYAEIADALVDVPEVVADYQREFLPKVRPGEGISVAIHTAERRKEAAWTALRGSEFVAAEELIREALELISPYPDERLPEAMLRDLRLLHSRIQFAGGARGPASMTLQSALGLDPSWTPRREVEHPRFLALFDEVDARRSQAPTGTLTLTSTAADVRVLVHGTDQGMVYDGSLILELPPGVYRVVGRKAGHADAVAEVRIRPKDEKAIELDLAIQNSVRFQETVQGALESPRRQRFTGVWDGLALAASTVDARAVLVGRFVANEDVEGEGMLHVGLYLPGRGGWSFHESLAVTGDAEATSNGVRDAIDRLNRSLDADLNPVFLAAQD